MALPDRVVVDTVLLDQVVVVEEAEVLLDQVVEEAEVLLDQVAVVEEAEILLDQVVMVEAEDLLEITETNHRCLRIQGSHWEILTNRKFKNTKIKKK